MASGLVRQITGASRRIAHNMSPRLQGLAIVSTVSKISASALKHRKQPETLRLRALMPELTVRDIERSLAWYRDVLGFVIGDVVDRDGQPFAAQLVAGKVRLLLTQSDNPVGDTRSKGEGIRIICATRQDIDELAALVRERGGSLDQEPQDQWSGRDFTVVDPDGFRLTFSTGSRS